MKSRMQSGVNAVCIMCLAALALAASNVGRAAEVYRWTDKDGKVHYSDAPPLDTKVETRKLNDNNAASDNLPYAVRHAAEIAPVTLYTSADCKDVCNDARKLLGQRKIPFSEKSVGTQTELDALKAIVGGKEPRVPVLVVGRKPVEGFEAGAWNSALDVAGYPKAP